MQQTNQRLSGIQKTFRYIMSHSTGKIEILDVGDDDRVYVAGREVCVALLGNDDDIEIFPLVEHDFSDRPVGLITCDDKMH